MSPLLSISGITINVEDTEVVHGLDLSVNAGEIHAIMGPNGSGKSTLMRAMVGLTPPAEGAVFASSRPNLLGVGAALLPDLSGDRNIVLGGLALGFVRGFGLARGFFVHVGFWFASPHPLSSALCPEAVCMFEPQSV